MHRRKLLGAGLASAAVLAMPRMAVGQTWPSQPVKIIVPSAPGGSLDILARLFGRGLQERLGQPFVVEPRAGGAGNIGYDATAKSKPDGYTIVIASDPITVNVSMYSNLSYDPLRDLTPIVNVASLAQVLAVHPSLPARDVAEFVTLAKTKPRALNIGSSGVGAPGHVAVALFAQAGIHLTHVPYRGAGPALIDVIAGQIDATCVTLPATQGFIRDGRVRALGVTSSKRSRFVPDVPTIAETIPGVVIDSWHGFLAPAGTPRDIVLKLNAELNALLKTTQIVDALALQAFEPAGGRPEDLGEFLQAEIVRLAPIIKAAGIKAD